ncbi:hypothetical protein OH77DRAFT_1403697 [Trametes cingulata]|nr:hypothetical protein OH77DRAFT_1403697 [Trametes cingulata]
MSTPSDLLTRLQHTLEDHPPFCGGTVALKKKYFELYYGKKKPGYIDLSECDQGQTELDALESACDPASFGRNQETVLDESYRKAGKMDASNFMTRLNVAQGGLLDAIRLGLFTGPASNRSIRAELYALNVYGKDAFFKPHVDTPRSSKMFGSLVIVFPTPHEGGELVLRSKGTGWTFNTAELLADCKDRIAYVAFFSDIEHEVLPVRSGHRVTLTYNLFYSSDTPRKAEPRKGLTVLQPPRTNPDAIFDSLHALLRNKDVLPRGGTLGFGLSHVYPLPSTCDVDDPDPLDSIMDALKGTDAALYHACERLGLNPRLRLITEDYDEPIILDHIGCFGGEVESPMRELLECEGGVILEDMESITESDTEDDEPRRSGSGSDDERLRVCWVTPMNEWNRTSTSYLAYGNEASMSYMYVSVCLFADVQESGKRDVEDLNAETGEDDE